jgi:hypothetical protein
MFDWWHRLFDPTRNWTPDPSCKLVFELDRGALNGVGMGDDGERLSFLGPSDDPESARRGIFSYHRLGYGFDWNDERLVDGCEVVFFDEFEKYQPFGGRITYNQEELRLAGMSESRFRERFPDIYWRDEDADEIILFYEMPNLEWQVEFDLAGIIKRVIVTDEPLMADAESRRGYQVTKAWPPETL